MNAEMMHITPTTEQRAKMAYVYIRQSSILMVDEQEAASLCGGVEWIMLVKALRCASTSAPPL